MRENRVMAQARVREPVFDGEQLLAVNQFRTGHKSMLRKQSPTIIDHFIIETVKEGILAILIVLGHRYGAT